MICFTKSKSRRGCIALLAWLTLVPAILVSGFSTDRVPAFALHNSPRVSRQPKATCGQLTVSTPRQSSIVILFQAKDKNVSEEERRRSDAIGGKSNGLVLLVAVVGLCVWFFTIPPEFRRARLCSEQDAAGYEQCWTVQEWTGGVADYYKSGGGVKFDFSIDPATLEENAARR